MKERGNESFYEVMNEELEEVVMTTVFKLLLEKSNKHQKALAALN